MESVAALITETEDLVKNPPLRGGLLNRYETLSAVLTDVEADLEAKGIVLKPLDHESHSGSIVREPFLYGGIPYNGQRKADYPIQTIKGRPTGKYYHLVIDRMENGRYEPVAYVL